MASRTGANGVDIDGRHQFIDYSPSPCLAAGRRDVRVTIRISTSFERPLGLFELGRGRSSTTITTPAEEDACRRQAGRLGQCSAMTPERRHDWASTRQSSDLAHSPSHADVERARQAQDVGSLIDILDRAPTPIRVAAARNLRELGRRLCGGRRHRYSSTLTDKCLSVAILDYLPPLSFLPVTGWQTGASGNTRSTYVGAAPHATVPLGCPPCGWMVFWPRLPRHGK
jgi:hypothetical protein